MGGISTGVVSVALLFLKPSDCLVGFGFAVCSMIMQHRRPQRLLGFAIGFLAAGLAMMTYLRFDFAAFWGDLQLLSAARSSSLSLWNVRWSLFKGLGDFLPLALLAVLTANIIASARPLLVTALVWMGGALLLATNAQPSGYPLNAVLALLLVEQGRAAMARVSWIAGLLKPETVLILLGLICYGPIAIGDASGLAYAFADSHRTSPVARFHAANLRNLILYDTPEGTDADQRERPRLRRLRQRRRGSDPALFRTGRNRLYSRHGESVPLRVAATSAPGRHAGVSLQSHLQRPAQAFARMAVRIGRHRDGAEASRLIGSGCGCTVPQLSARHREQIHFVRRVRLVETLPAPLARGNRPKRWLRACVEHSIRSIGRARIADHGLNNRGWPTLDFVHQKNQVLADDP